DYERRVPVTDSVETLLQPHRSEINSIRMTAMIGQRNIWYVERRGLDSMRGEEDVRLGAEITFALGRSLHQFESDDDLATTLTAYTGFEVGDALIVARARGDARRDLRADVGTAEWKDLYGEAELLSYLQADMLPRHTFFLRAAAGGGWHTVTPFQLTLGGLRGVRGYSHERYPGGRRVVASLEDRIYFGWPFTDLADVGATVFADAGRVWQGDAPFGVDSDWRASAGFGLRVSFPAGGRSIARLDVAWPIEPGVAISDFRLMFSLDEIIGLSADARDAQLLRSRRESVGGDLFTPRF
ncbi:MAG: BamA/TamA family outer membrane protein, partial [Longimicrobiales bacterium]